MHKPWVPQFTLKNVAISKEEVVFSGHCQVTQFELQFSLFEGGMSKTVPRELIYRPSAVAVLLYDPVSDKVVLVEQFRIGAIREAGSPWLLEIVAGVPDPDESVEAAVYREVTEETGCTVLSLIPICGYFTSPGISAEKIFIYCGYVKAPEIGGNHGLVEEGEDIRVCVLETEEAFKLLRDGKIVSSPAVIALQWLKINQPSLHVPLKIE